ncbi:MAG: hypothetical protein SGJ10_10675 [Bacteroidota bacterium]|nr:hypothetical protein [Bacteroidota bacterium]
MVKGEHEKNKKILEQLAGKPVEASDGEKQQTSDAEKQGFIFIPFSNFWKGQVKGMGSPVEENEKVPFLMRLWIRYENWKDKLWKNSSSSQTFVNEGNSTLNGLFTKTGKKNSLHLQGMQSNIQVNLGQYIHELLFEHNCVIVPELGGFISRRVTSQLNHVAHKISPPGKKIAFNQGLNVNDGLLAQTISKQENVSYEIALQHIASQVINLRQQLHSDKSVSLDKIGNFVIDQEEVLTFHPEIENNFDKHTYGLVTIQAIPMVRHENEKLKRKIKARIENRRPAKQALPKRKGAVGRVVMNTLLILMASLLSFASVMVNTDQKASLFSFNWGQLFTNPFSQSEITDNNIPKISLDNKIIAQINQVGFERKGEYIIVIKSFDNITAASEFSTTLNVAGLTHAKPCSKEEGRTWVGVCRGNNEDTMDEILEQLIKTYPEAKLIQK